MAKIGLVTVLFNSDTWLEGFFKSLSVQTFNDYHLYLIDNTPSQATDECLSKLIQKFPIPAYTHIKSKTNIGIAKANNIGIKASLKQGSEYVVLLNNDIEFGQTDLLESMVSIADERGEVLVVPKIFFYDTGKIWMAGGHFQWWKAMPYHVGEGKFDSSKYSSMDYFDFAPGCFILIKAIVFEMIGVLDEKYFVYVEDTDFLYRAAQYKYKILLCPQLKILHKVSSSTGGVASNFSIYYGNRNRIYFINKHFKSLKRFVALFYVLSTRAFKYLGYETKQRKILINSIKDGFAMNLD